MAADGLNQGQAFWRALYYFNLYRLCLGVSFVALALGRTDIGQLGDRIPDLFITASIGIVVMAILNMITITRGDPPFRQQAHVQFTMDVILITMLSFSSGGIGSGVNLLLIVSVAAGGVVLSGRMSLFFAALATLLTFAEQLLSEWLYGAVSGSYFQVGLLGIALFSTGLLVYFFAFRIRRAEAMVEKSAADLASLAKLNEVVVDRLDTGVVVASADGAIKLLNDRARKLMAIADDSHGTQLPNDLDQALSSWRQAPEEQGEREIASRRGNFAVRIQRISDDGDAVIFLEDLTQTERRAQQLKLAALGRLTGAVAHEIRNPLAAISHAGQLMGESSTLTADDRRLVDIISRHSDRIDQIVSSILALGRPRSAQLTSIALKPWLREFCQAFAESHNTDADELLVLEAADITVCTNPDHLAQVLTNLCENALRHGQSEDDRPRVRLEAGVDGEVQAAHLDVINAGPAIDADIREKMFEPFFSTDGKGLGLGLYLSRELCQNNYGRLDYIANEHSGRFRIQFAPATACEEQ